MAERNSNNNFFSTIGRGNGDSDGEGDLTPDLSALASGPTFVKSQAKTLF